MRASLLLLGVLLSFSAALQASSGGDGDEESLQLLNSFCQLPPVREKCSNESSLRVFYNSQAGLCERFVHHGCEGNKNNFATQLECLQACARRDICQLPSDSGFGDVYQSRFFYNTITDTCESFLHKGHGGNANNFWQEETCTQFCASQSKAGGTSQGALRPSRSQKEEVPEKKSAMSRRMEWNTTRRKWCPGYREAGPCVKLCGAHRHCGLGRLCCYNGCGYVCQRAVSGRSPDPPPGRRSSSGNGRSWIQLKGKI